MITLSGYYCMFIVHFKEVSRLEALKQADIVARKLIIPNERVLVYTYHN